MNVLHLGAVEARFAELVWENAPMTTRQLIDLCAEHLHWKRTTTYTVLKKCCVRGLFKTEGSTVTVVTPREEFFALQGEAVIQNGFGNSLPDFLAAYTRRRKLSGEEVKVIRKLLDTFEKEG